MTQPRMTVEVWSDIVCPFCYVGKRRFENALAQFQHARHVDVVRKSFQLNPGVKTDPSLDLNAWLAREKGISPATAKQMNERVTAMAAGVDLEYHLEKAVVANTFKAHTLLHFAKQQGLQVAAQERLFKAYFTEGKNIDDLPTLLELGAEIGLAPDALAAALTTGAFDGAVQADIDEAQRLGIHGVPFFVFDRKYGVSGAQETPMFLQALGKAFEEWQAKYPEGLLDVVPGPACTPDGVC